MRSLFTTTLFIEGSEVSYSVFVKPDTGRFLFQPSSPEVGYYSTPCFWVFNREGQWLFLGTANKEIKEQVVTKITTHLDNAAAVNEPAQQLVSSSKEAMLGLVGHALSISTSLSQLLTTASDV